MSCIYYDVRGTKRDPSQSLRMTEQKRVVFDLIGSSLQRPFIGGCSPLSITSRANFDQQFDDRVLRRTSDTARTGDAASLTELVED